MDRLASIGRRGRRSPSMAFGCATPGNRVRYFTAAELVETLYRGLADNSVGRVIDTLLRNDLIIVDLCRHRDYAEPPFVRVSIA